MATQHEIKLAESLNQKLFEISQDFWTMAHPEAGSHVLLTAATMNLMQWLMVDSSSKREALEKLAQIKAILALWITTTPDYLLRNK